jgi:hypothetical protein
MHFPADYASIDSPFEGLSALQYYVFLLTNLPQLAFASDAYISLKPGGAQVSGVTVTLPGKEPVDAATFQNATAMPGSNSNTSSPALQVVDIDVSTLAVPTAAEETPSFNMSQVVDTEPPRLTLLGDLFVKVLQAEPYDDAGARAADNIDGNAVVIRRRTQLCRWQEWMQTATAESTNTLSCSNTTVGVVQTALPLTSEDNEEQVYVLTYTARDTAGNQADPVRRYVAITPR